MSIHLYGPNDKLPDNVASRLIDDHSTCAVGAVCAKQAIGVYLKQDPETGQDKFAWSNVGSLAENPEDDPVLCCEDCLLWLCDVFNTPYPKKG